MMQMGMQMGMPMGMSLDKSGTTIGTIGMATGTTGKRTVFMVTKSTTAKHAG